MKKLILIAGAAALAACGETATEDTAPADETMVDEADAMVETDADYTMRSYSWTGPEGQAMVMSVDADGNYISEADGNHYDHGTVTLNDEGKICFESAMDQPDGCWTYSDLEVGGSMDSMSDEGATVTVTRTEYVELSMPGA